MSAVPQRANAPVDPAEFGAIVAALHRMDRVQLSSIKMLCFDLEARRPPGGVERSRRGPATSGAQKAKEAADQAAKAAKKKSSAEKQLTLAQASKARSVVQSLLNAHGVLYPNVARWGSPAYYHAWVATQRLMGPFTETTPAAKADEAWKLAERNLAAGQELPTLDWIMRQHVPGEVQVLLTNPDWTALLNVDTAKAGSKVQDGAKKLRMDEANKMA